MSCEIEMATKLLQIVHDTVGLHTHDQVSSLKDLVKLACPSAGIDQISDAVKQAYLALFGEPM